MRDVCLDRDLSTKRNIHVLKCLGYAQLPPVSPSGGRALLWAGWVPAEQLNPTVLQSAGGMLCALPLSPPPALPHSAKKILPKKTFLLQYSITCRALPQCSAGFQAHPNVINVF